MAVDAVAFVVLQKLSDLLSEKSFARKKVIVSQLEQMQKDLEETKGFFMDAADKVTNDKEIEKWTTDYLSYLYEVEDSFEWFALRITRERKRVGFLMNHALFLKKFTACKKLSRKIKKIQRGMKALKRPQNLEDASLRGLEYSLRTVSPVNEEEEEEDDGGGGEEEEEQQQKEEEEEEEATAATEQSSSAEELRRTGTYSSPARTLSISTQQAGISPRSLSSPPFLTRSDTSVLGERYKLSVKLMYSYSYNDEESIIGYQRMVPKLVERLEKSDELIIPLVGKMGSGKTMMARAVYGNTRVKELFKPAACAWATIFKESTTTDILLNLLKQLNKSKEDDTDEIFLKEKLGKQLNSRYLIVLDGIATCQQWESLKDTFPNEKNGSKIILTSRIHLVQQQQPHRMKKLDSKDSWALFLRNASLPKDHPPILSLKNRILEVCRGLPLNIVLLGSLFSIKSENEWNDILSSQSQTSDIVMLSYNDLEPPLKLCLLYMMLFPKEIDIPVRRLQRLWLAEGFVKRPQEGEFPEDVAQVYFENLVRRSLIMVSKMRSDGSPRKCRLLGVLHDYLLDNARYIRLFHVHGGFLPDCRVNIGKRRLIEYADGENFSLNAEEYHCMRSYISFNLQKKDTPAKYVGTLVSKMIGKRKHGLLRVLDLEGVYKPSLPENLGDLFHLRYLGLRWTFLDKLPKSVGELPYLETLDLKHTFINQIPPSIWKLKHLRHLNLNEIHLDKDTPLHLRNTLPKLLTLWGLSINQDSPVNNGLSRFTDLRELGISFRFSKSSVDDHANSTSPTPTPQFTQDLLDWISKLTDLRSLRLRSKDDCGHPADVSLKSFSDLIKLSHMNILGKLRELPQTNQFPPYIKVLTLSVSLLEQDPMPILGKLAELRVLRLLANSYLGEEMDCPSGTFQNLEVLKLWMLKNLKKWQVEEGSMTNLKELNIRCCSKLQNIPSRLLQQNTFQDLILNNMPREFKEKVQENKNKQQGKFLITVKSFERLNADEDFNGHP